jgi:hypothetical protein
MPSSRSKPIIIPAAPKSSHNLHHHSNLSPSTPPSPKQVRFAHPSTELASRPLTPQEAWSLYHFETHARACHSCDGRSLCPAGYGLSQDVRVHVWKHEKQLCSTRPDSEGRWVRVEIPHGYGWTKAMLGVERTRSSDKLKPKKSTTKSSPVVSYDPEPRPARKVAEPHSSSRDNTNNNVYVEPARTPKDGEKRSRHRPERYEVVEVAPKYEQGGPVRLPERAKRGSLYESDMRRPRREYRIEERAPERGQDREQRVERERESEKDREERHERRRREREREWRERDGGR